ncbi:hypothetical protein DCW30_28615 [Streptomyces alfalfae]|uniref:Lipoprotein n=1 Tax=Streptomyces alfalfae TaxID=1642299 RepID=A0A1P8TGG8_9ACTN|nr:MULTISPECIES: hypothetical protein [Streptomyces]AYA17094.1 hypothetical protein D3X13_13340 [Streptomyces fradiae]APY86708.1 hypothetical protein A7J05_14095 [Streptomyces alfalfae]QQC91037.1 hypothetical protein I8755_23475 [Streptomyces alfalfae]QUI33525.1 hypothetical protein H9W91_23665 [Streptomyces alfalfae]RXX37819.1 hypothetical protein DCW30_28615 [Streptomyces alfalfae]
MTGRRIRAAVVTAVLAAGLAGCGIRSTEVPTDFGPAPSRVPCLMSGSSIASQSGSEVPVQVFLVCAAQLVTVDRAVRVHEGKATTDRVRIAQALLDELAASPSEGEKQAGFATDVRGGITVSGPARGEPEEAVRLSRPPQDLSAFALAQIVCTLADSAASAEDQTVIMGGPGGDPLRRYTCAPEVRSRPGSAEPPSETVR